MNIVLVPYTMTRHLVVAWFVGGAALLAWWFLLGWIVWAGPALEPWGLLPSLRAEGAWFLGLVAGAIAGSSLYAEHALRRTVWWKRFALVAGCFITTLVIVMIGYTVTQLLHKYLLTSPDYRSIAGDPSTVSLRYRVLTWLFAGGVSGVVPAAFRRFEGFFGHAAGGLGAGAAGALVWHHVGYWPYFEDVYLAAALAAWVWGTLHGLLIWPIPRSLYAGWIRVLSDSRFAWRVPIDRGDGAPVERFVGHFPRGLDLFLPVELGVAELHVSVLVDREQAYALRGLSIQPTLLKRLLESVDLRYDPRRPAPLETPLAMEDRVVMGPGCEFEFLLLPKEEQ